VNSPIRYTGAGMADAFINQEKIIKWFKAPKTIQGLVGFTVIVILLGLDFWWWANNIEVGVLGDNSIVIDDDDIEIPDDYDTGSISDSLDHGRKLFALQQQTNDPRGEGEGETYNLYTFPVLINISTVQIESSGSGGRPRIDGGDVNDVDLYLYEPGNDAGGNFESTSPRYQAATPSINEVLSEDDIEPGNWTLRVDCFTGNNVQYNIQIQVIYSIGNETEE
jgi:hypothetical protein